MPQKQQILELFDRGGTKSCVVLNIIVGTTSKLYVEITFIGIILIKM